jgi:hypothetical protein
LNARPEISERYDTLDMAAAPPEVDLPAEISVESH